LNTHLNESDRARLQAMTAPIAQINAQANAWRDRLCSEIDAGPATADEVAALLARTRYERGNVRLALVGLRKRGLIRERPLIPSAGRAVRVVPVMVLEVVR